MKKFLVTLLFFGSLSIGYSQYLDIPKSKLASKAAFGKPKLEIKIEAGWENKSGIKFTGMADGDNAKLIVKHKTTGVRIAGTESADKTEILITLTEPTLSGKSNLFSVSFAGTALDDIEITKDGEFVNRTGGGPDKSESGSANDFMGALINFNFSGDNKFLSNLTPIINYGWRDTLPHGWEIEVNPYLGSQIDSKQASSFIPSLMLYGRAGIAANLYNRIKTTNGEWTLMPIGLGGKYISALGEQYSLIQHNYRIGIGYSHKNLLMVAAQYTHGWHNLVSHYDKNFHSVFGKMATDIDYMTVSVQTAISGKTNQVDNFVWIVNIGMI